MTPTTEGPDSRLQPDLSSRREGDLLGFDIGGTKCAVSRLHGGRVEEIVRIPTGDFESTFAALAEAARQFVSENPLIGISCGGPLDAAQGVILSPPNLHSSWHGADICRKLMAMFNGRAVLMNDANACALAEWQFGAGRGCKHMIFLTSGTGMGAGIILNGQLYEGASGDAGEVGHIRLSPEGPVGFGKAGSFEGFCSGGGIARLTESVVRRQSAVPSWYSKDGTPTTRDIADAARAGDVLAREVMRESGSRLGAALALMIDMLNPERIVIGGFFSQCRDLLEPSMHETLAQEALPHSLAACRILPAELGATIGSHGAIAIALRARGGA